VTAAPLTSGRGEVAAMLGRLAVVPDHSGALWLPEERMLVVADLHLEKGSAYAARGVFLPPYDTAATLAGLAAAVMRRRPARIVALGDSFHDRTGAERLDPSARAALAELQRGRDWLWITGNHDPAIGGGLSGERADALLLAGVTLRHEPSPRPSGPEIAGHLHPAAKVRLRGRAIRRRAFALSAERCILPALGAYAGGLNLRDEAFRPLFRAGLVAHVLGDSRLFALDRRLLLPD